MTVYSDCILFNRRINIITQNSTEKQKINIQTLKLGIYTLTVTKTRKTLGLRSLLKQLVLQLSKIYKNHYIKSTKLSHAQRPVYDHVTTV